MAEASVIILNYNGSNLTIDCLKAIEKQSFRDFDVILVDNGSNTDARVSLDDFINTTSLNMNLKFVPLSRNLGFAGGNIIGLEYTTGDYIALLNNDTEPSPNWLGELVGAMNRHPGAGICASKMLVHNSDIIDTAGDGFVRSLKGFKRGEGQDKQLYHNEEFVFGACAGAALYRRKMIEDIGFLDEDFFLIHEDSDLNFRAQLCGWKVVYVPTAMVSHKVRSSIGHKTELEVYHTLRNSYLVKIKNTPLGVLALCSPEILGAAFMEFIYFVIKHRKAKLYLRSIGDAVTLLPSMLTKRRTNMKHKRVTNSYLISMMTPVYGKGVLRAKLKKLLHD